MLAILFVQGISFGVLWILLSKTSATPPAAPPIVLSTPGNQSGFDIYGPQQNRQTAEKLLLADNPAQAIPHLLNAAPNRIENSDDPLLFRIALCFEASADTRRAAGLFEHLVGRSDNNRLVAASRLGLARCRLANGDLAGARDLLWRQYLQLSSGPESKLDSESLFLLTRCFGGTTRRQTRKLLQRGHLIENLQPKLNVARQLKMVIDAAGSREPGAAEGDRAGSQIAGSPGSVRIENIVQIDDSPENTIASFRIQQASLISVFQWMSRKFEIPVEITDVARDLAKQQLVTIHMDHVSVLTALDAQTLPFGLGWRIEGNTVAVFRLEEAPEDTRRQVQRNAAIRMLESLLLVNPEHEFADYSRFYYANLLNQDGDSANAIAINQELLSSQIDPRLRQAANFNLGQLQRDIDNGHDAINSFGRVADSNEAGGIQAVAYINAGQIHMEFGEFVEAVSAFSRAYRSGDDTWTRQLAKIGLASAYLLNDEGRLARNTLVNSRRVFADRELAAVSDFLIAFGNMKSKSGAATYEERSELLSALTRLNWRPDYGTGGPYLMALAYRDLGFSDEAISLLSHSVESGAGFWLRQVVTQQLTALLLDEGRLDEARDALLHASQFSELNETGLLSMRFAFLEFQAGNADACLQHCRQIVGNDQMSGYHSDALKLMGEIFQERGEHYHAALCFSGLLPELP